jgi:hypothetical protein
MVPAQRLEGSGEIKKKGPRPDRVLYSKQELLDHMLKCEELCELYLKEHDKIAGEVRKNWKPYCRVAGDAEIIKAAKKYGTYENECCFVWHGREASGKVS